MNTQPTTPETISTVNDLPPTEPIPTVLPEPIEQSIPAPITAIPEIPAPAESTTPSEPAVLNSPTHIGKQTIQENVYQGLVENDEVHQDAIKLRQELDKLTAAFYKADPQEFRDAHTQLDIIADSMLSKLESEKINAIKAHPAFGQREIK